MQLCITFFNRYTCVFFLELDYPAALITLAIVIFNQPIIDVTLHDTILVPIFARRSYLLTRDIVTRCTALLLDFATHFDATVTNFLPYLTEEHFIPIPPPEVEQNPADWE